MCEKSDEKKELEMMVSYWLRNLKTVATVTCLSRHNGLLFFQRQEKRKNHHGRSFDSDYQKANRTSIKPLITILRKSLVFLSSSYDLSRDVFTDDVWRILSW